MKVDLSGHFQQYIEQVSLPALAIDRIERASSTLMEFLVKEFNLGNADVFLQGSYPNGTAIRPLDGGEYDVDLVFVMSNVEESSDAALNRLEESFKADGRYAPRVVSKKPCVRLEYAEDEVGKFHVDVVPLRRAVSGASLLEAPRRGEGWHSTAPAEYTDWCTAQGIHFERTVKALKRWRDDQQSVHHAIKSIVLQVLASQYMTTHTDDAARLHGTFAAMHDALASLSSAPVIPNPVLPSENLAARWINASFRDFVAELTEARDVSERAIATADPVEAADCWREILGEDFPTVPTEALGIRVSDDSHAHTYATRGWTENLDERYGVRVVASTARGKRSPHFIKYENNGGTLFHGRKIKFEALTRGPDDVEVWWQVANTGRHARELNGLRGAFFKAKKLNGRDSANPRENWEDTNYTGAHWIRAVLVKANKVVAASDKFVVNIYNNSHRFGL